MAMTAAFVVEHCTRSPSGWHVKAIKATPSPITPPPTQKLNLRARIKKCRLNATMIK